MDAHSRRKRLSLLLSTVLVFVLGSCGSESANFESTSSMDGKEESVPIENPYDPDTGHYAGYEWAERTGGDCTTASQPFNEGCEEYYRQITAQR
jgi:hypothetical protein